MCLSGWCVRLDLCMWFVGLCVHVHVCVRVCKSLSEFVGCMCVYACGLCVCLCLCMHVCVFEVCGQSVPMCI